MLMLATADASTASVVTTGFDEPICSIPPTRMIPEIALVWDMSGVCRAWLTCEIT